MPLHVRRHEGQVRELAIAVDAAGLVVEHQRRRPERRHTGWEQQLRERWAVGREAVIDGHSRVTCEAMVLLADTRIRSGYATQSSIAISHQLGLAGCERRLWQGCHCQHSALHRRAEGALRGQAGPGPELLVKARLDRRCPRHAGERRLRPPQLGRADQIVAVCGRSPAMRPLRAAAGRPRPPVPACPSRKPCAASQPRSRRNASCSRVSTPSAVTRLPRLCPSATTAAAIASPPGLAPDVGTNEPSTFTLVEREVLEVRQRAVAGPEVVDRQRHPEPRHLAQRAPGSAPWRGRGTRSR